MKTKAAVLYKLNSPLVIEELEIPKLNSGQVLVKVKASGICRSQLNEIKGLKGGDKYLPHLLGHEGAGIVLNIGHNVSKVKKRDHVVITWIKGRGLEAGPVKYLKNKKVINSGPIAAFTKYAVISENRIVKISKDISLELASLLGCAVPTGAGIIINTLKNIKLESLAVFGCGGIGGGAIMGAKMRGIKKIIAVDINPAALSYARKLGATDTIKFQAKTIVDQIKKLVSNGLDAAIEASGNKLAMEKAIESVKDDGTVVIAGNIKYNEKISVNPFDFIKGKIILGTWGGETDPDRDIHFYISEYKKGKLKLENMIGGRFKLDEINSALKLLEEGKSFGRLIINL